MAAKADGGTIGRQPSRRPCAFGALSPDCRGPSRGVAGRGVCWLNAGLDNPARKDAEQGGRPVTCRWRGQVSAEGRGGGLRGAGRFGRQASGRAFLKDRAGVTERGKGGFRRRPERGVMARSRRRGLPAPGQTGRRNAVAAA